MSISPDPSVLVRLDAGMSYRLTLLLLPTSDGTGAAQTDRLLKAWMAQASWPIYRLVLTRRHNDPGCFCRDLAASLVPVTGPLAVDGLSPEGCVVDIINAIARSVAPEATERGSDFALVLEGYATIVSPVIHKALGLMLDYLPPPLHVVIVSTDVPPLLNIPRLRARRQLLQISL